MADDAVGKQRQLPDPDICCTKHLGPGLDLSICLVDNPDACQYAVRFGSTVLCRHPDRRSFEKLGKP